MIDRRQNVNKIYFEINEQAGTICKCFQFQFFLKFDFVVQAERYQRKLIYGFNEHEVMEFMIIPSMTNNLNKES